MTAMAGYGIRFVATGAADDIEEALGTTPERLSEVGSHTMWTVTARDAAELHGILDRLRAARFTLDSVDRLERPLPDATSGG